jgi:hypothetical protein
MIIPITPTTKTIMIAIMGNSGGRCVWPSRETAALLYDIANWVLLLGLVLGVVATVFIIWMGNAKEGYLKRDLAEGNERAAKAELAAAEANKIAEGERLARVKIEEKLAPRRFSNDQLQTIVLNMSKWAKLPGTDIRQDAAVFSISSDFESTSLANQIAAALGAAGWNINRFPVTFGKSYSVSGIGILTSSNSRGMSVGNALSKSLNAERMLTTIFSERRSGCEEMNMEASKIKTNPACSQISVFVGDHP